MRTLKEEIRMENELEMLTESVVEKHLQKLIDQLKRYGYSAKELFKIAPVAWDEIDASRVTVYRDPSDKSEIKEYTSYVKDDNYVVFGILNDQAGVMFYKGNITYLPTNDKHKGKMLNSWDIRAGSEFWRKDNSQRSIKTKAEDKKETIYEIADLCYDPVCDWLWVVDSTAFKIYICTIDGELLATYDVSDIENAESICVDRERGCVWVASDEDAPKLYKYSFEF